MTELTDVDAIVNDMLNPLRETLARIDAEIAEHEAAIAALKQTRAKPARILAAAERTPKAPGPKPGAKKPPPGVAQETLAEVADWLRANTNDEAFHASGLARHDGFTILKGQAGISRALVSLADQGVLRLDHTGPGGGKFYKLAASS